MKLFYVLIILVLFHNCSFDDKTGIWNNENSISKNTDSFKQFKAITSPNETFNKIVPLNNEFKFRYTNPINNMEWTDYFYNENNNFINFKYNDSNRQIFKAKKITNYKVNNFLLFEKNNIITSDNKGNIIIYSINDNKVKVKFNFYKKKYKKIKKILNLIVEKNIIYVSDNIGYLYAFNYIDNKILWAKNYKIPFRSNLKLVDNKLVAANQNNSLFFFNKNNGDILSLIPTEESVVKNEFVNNIAIGERNTFFLNTYGSLYAIDNDNMRIVWFLNLNQSIDLNPSNLFKGNQIVLNNEKVTVTTNQFTYVLEAKTGSLIYKKNFNSLVKPLIINNYLFLITSENLLISLNLQNGEIIYSYNINQKIADYLDIKKKKAEFKSLMMVNGNIYIFLKNSYILKFNVRGTLVKVDKLPSKINTQPIFIDSSILYLNNSNKLFMVN